MTRRWHVPMLWLVAFVLLPLVYIGCQDYDGAPLEVRPGPGPPPPPPAPLPTQSNYVLTANTNADSISVFQIGSDGSLTSIDNVNLAPGSAPTMIALHPGGQFLYVVNSTAKNEIWDNNASIGAYAYNSSTGAIEEIDGSPFHLPLEGGKSNSTFVNMAITPNGNYLYVGDVSNHKIRIFRINTSTGALTLVDSASNANEPHGLAIHPSGKYLYAGLKIQNPEGGRGIESFVILDNGSLTQMTGSPLDLVEDFGDYVWLEVTPDGKFLYGADGGGTGYLVIASINADDGSLSDIGSIPLGGEVQIKTIKVTPDGKYIYLAYWNLNFVVAEFIQSDGSILPVPVENPFYDVGSQPTSVTVTRDSGMLYVANYDSNDVTAYKILVDGSLGDRVTYPLPEGAGPKFIVALP